MTVLFITATTTALCANKQNLQMITAEYFLL